MSLLTVDHTTIREADWLQSLVPAVPTTLAWTTQICPAGRLGEVTLADEVSVSCTITVGAEASATCQL
jgi:hypothetical protein